jgi:hypothetical protein
MNKINFTLYKEVGFSEASILKLQNFLEANPSIHWITLSPSGVYELVLDNQMFSTYRGCPSNFFTSYVEGYSPKGEAGRNWFLEFGILFHKMVEFYYRDFRSSGFDLNNWAIEVAVNEWNKRDMNYHSEHKEFKSMGGVHGFVGLLVSYAIRFNAENERIRVIGTEIAFGKNHEVPLGALYTEVLKFIPYKKHFELAKEAWLKCFLSGRIDMLIDDGSVIGPMDHKTMASFRGDPALRYELDEGPTGYVYAVNQILPSFLKAAGLDESLLRRSCNKILMNFISKSVPKEGERFKRIPILKTTEQLESYRNRMLSTSASIFRDLVSYASHGEKFIQRDTSKCTNWYMRDCPLIAVHRQNSRENELLTLNAFFEKKPVWDTENLGGE